MIKSHRPDPCALEGVTDATQVTGACGTETPVNDVRCHNGCHECPHVITESLSGIKLRTTYRPLSQLHVEPGVISRDPGTTETAFDSKLDDLFPKPFQSCRLDDRATCRRIADFSGQAIRVEF